MTCILRLCYKTDYTFFLPRNKTKVDSRQSCSANSNTLTPSYLVGVGASTKCQCGSFFSYDFLSE